MIAERRFRGGDSRQGPRHYDGYVCFWHFAAIDADFEHVRFRVKRTWPVRALMSANDPKRKSEGTPPTPGTLTFLMLTEFTHHGFAKAAASAVVAVPATNRKVSA